MLSYRLWKVAHFSCSPAHLCPTSSQWLPAISCRFCGDYIEVADERSGLYTKAQGFAAALLVNRNHQTLIYQGREFPYGSPEVLVSSHEWRCALQGNTLKEQFMAVVVDEAHTVVQR